MRPNKLLNFVPATKSVAGTGLPALLQPISNTFNGGRMIQQFAFLLFIALGTFELEAKEICDESSRKCAKVGSGAAWLLSIIETSTSSCPSSVAVTTWLNDNRWLVEKVKSQERQYNQFIEMQHRVFWASNNPDIKVTCDRVVKLVSKVNPLAQELR